MRVKRRLTLPLGAVKAAHRRVCETPQAKHAYTALWKIIGRNQRTAKQAFIDNHDQLLVYMLDNVAGEPTKNDIGVVYRIKHDGSFDSILMSGVENLTDLRIKVRDLALAK